MAFFGIVASIHIGREIQCLPYAGYLSIALKLSIRRNTGIQLGKKRISNSIDPLGTKKIMLFKWNQSKEKENRRAFYAESRKNMFPFYKSWSMEI